VSKLFWPEAFAPNAWGAGILSLAFARSSKRVAPDRGCRVTIVRPETLADVTAIRDVHVSSFPTIDEARLVEALRANGRLSLSFVAGESEAIVGHVAFSPVTLSGVAGGSGLAPLAVLPSFRRRGIGEALIRDGLIGAERAGFRFVVVLGEPGYYGRFGFQPASRWGLRDEYEGGAAFQALELRPAALPAAGGLVRYAPEFAGWTAADSGGG
jgi:putative acetyltransferase